LTASAPPALDSAVSTPSRIGHYPVERILGKGGFGIVYLTHDDELQRPVAVFVPPRFCSEQLFCLRSPFSMGYTGRGRFE
jgi:hypothetical protein